MTTRIRLSGLAAILACAVCLLPADEHFDRSVGAGAIAYQYTGRVDPAHGIVYGYFTQIAGVTPSSLFKGSTQSETTALFTLRADVTLTPLAGNGDLGMGQFAVQPFVVAPGDFKVYYNANPNRTWTDASTFSSGQVIATFSRTIDQQNVIGPISINSASATLKWSVPVPVNSSNMHNLDLGRLVPRGVTNVTTVYNAPLAGGTFAFAGYGLAIGN